MSNMLTHKLKLKQNTNAKLSHFVVHFASFFSLSCWHFSMLLLQIKPFCFYLLLNMEKRVLHRICGTHIKRILLFLYICVLALWAKCSSPIFQILQMYRCVLVRCCYCRLPTSLSSLLWHFDSSLIRHIIEPNRTQIGYGGFYKKEYKKEKKHKQQASKQANKANKCHFSYICV